MCAAGKNQGRSSTRRTAEKTRDGSEDRRSGSRNNRQFRVYYRSADGSYVPTWALNVSPQGARLVIHDRAGTGYDVELWLHVGRHCFRLEVQKVWETLLPGGRCRVVGVVFNELEPERAELLGRLLTLPEEPETRLGSGFPIAV